MSDANRTGLAYAVETTFGSSPSTAFQDLRFTGESLNYSIQSTNSQEIDPSRMVSDNIITNKQAGGGFNFELSYGTYDELLAGALFSSWSGSDLRNGTTETSFAIERSHADLTTPLYFIYNGMMVNTLSMSVTSGQIVTGSFDFIGTSAGLSATTASNPATLLTATSTTPFNAVGNIGTIYEGGGPMTGVYVQSMNFTLSNNLRGQSAIGYDYFVDIGVGQCSVTGSMSVYFKNSTLYDKLLAGTESSFSFVATDGAANSYTFEFPRIKYSGGGVNASSINTDVMLNLDFTCLNDTDGDSDLIHITKS